MGKRFETPDQGCEYESEYDFPSSEIWDIQNRGVSPVKVISNIDISKIGIMWINEPGEAFVFRCTDKTTGLIYQEALINVYVNAGDASDPTRNFPAKPQRGFNGSFQSLYLTWPADASGSYNISFIIYKSKNYPWIGGVEAT